MVAARSDNLVQDNPGELEVSVVMPCLNEARTVGRCVGKAGRLAWSDWASRGEVIVADNGSTDGSQDIAREHGARVVHVAAHAATAAPCKAGIAAARGRYIIMGDADDSYDFTRLEPFVEQLRPGDDLVMGNRFQGGIKPGAMPWLHRYVGNPVLTGILNLFFRSPIGDAHCGLRGFRKDAYQRLGLTTPGMEFASEMVVKACLHRQKISEVPTTLHPDGRDRPPHLRSFRDGWRHLRFLLLMCPLWLYLIPAGAADGGGLGLMAWLTPGPRAVGGVVLDIHTMLLGALCVLAGLPDAVAVGLRQDLRLAQRPVAGQHVLGARLRATSTSSAASWPGRRCCCSAGWRSTAGWCQPGVRLGPGAARSAGDVPLSPCGASLDGARRADRSTAASS